MKDIRILFMGTPEFAVHILSSLVEHKYIVAGVVTAPDKPAGRGQKIRKSAVKKYAEKQGLKILQPTNLKSDTFQEELKTISPDVAVVVAFRMLPEKVWAFPPLGTFNLHASLLPDYRGAAPINWAIINGEKKSGVTTFFLNHQIDTGKIIAQKEVEITTEDTAGSLHDKLMEKGAELVLHTLTLIDEEKIKPQKQEISKKLKSAPKFTSENTQVDWNQSPNKIYNFVRGLNPFPIAWTYLQDEREKMRCKVFQVTPIQEEHSFKIGKILMTKEDLKVAVKGGFIAIQEMQLPGKKRLHIKELRNGLHLSEEAKML